MLARLQQATVATDPAKFDLPPRQQKVHFARWAIKLGEQGLCPAQSSHVNSNAGISNACAVTLRTDQSKTKTAIARCHAGAFNHDAIAHRRWFHFAAQNATKRLQRLSQSRLSRHQPVRPLNPDPLQRKRQQPKSPQRPWIGHHDDDAPWGQGPGNQKSDQAQHRARAKRPAASAKQNGCLLA
jgi:hypothetical protein